MNNLKVNSKAPLPNFSIIQRMKLFNIGISKWNIPTYTNADELFKLYDLAKSLGVASIGVEIGSYTGASSLMIGKGLNSESKLYCVDTWENDAMTEGNWNSYNDFKINTHQISDKIVAIKSNSIDAAKNFNDKIDFLFIDGDHSYEGVKADADVWFEKLKSGGILIMHDSGWAEGVIKVIREDVKPYLKKSKQLPNIFWGWKK